MVQRIKILFRPIILLLAWPSLLYSWGEEGHKIVAEIAKRHLDKETLAQVEDALDGATFAEASIWMDEVRKESRYYHMVTWHYINLEKDEVYKRNKEENSVNELRLAVKKLNNRKKYKKAETAKHLKILFHLIGDLHQPLHNGYGSDRGGNNVKVEMNGNETNLHGVWDYEIISEKKITADDCMKLKATISADEMKAIQVLNVENWFLEARAHVEPAYQVGDGKLTAAYIDQNAQVIRKQMLKGGIRLATVLMRLFKRGAKAEKAETDR